MAGPFIWRSSWLWWDHGLSEAIFASRQSRAVKLSIGIARQALEKRDGSGTFVARKMRAGGVSINGASQDYMAPFGGYKQSGNGREYGEYGLRDFLEIKVINGFAPV